MILSIPPISPYAATKRAGELLCYNWHHLYNLSVVCLRFFTVYGPRQKTRSRHPQIQPLDYGRAAIPIFGDGATSRDYTYIDDIIEGVISAINFSRRGCHYEIINLGESETISLSAMLPICRLCPARKSSALLFRRWKAICLIPMQISAKQDKSLAIIRKYLSAKE